MSRMKESEVRFREGRGARYLGDGVTIRCQSVTKDYMKKAREERADPDLTTAEVWPEGQCSRRAELGAYLCWRHGGLTPGSEKHPLLQFMPVDLAEKLEILADHPDYLSRYSEIVQLQARNAALYERLGQGVVHKAVREDITRAISQLRGNALIDAIRTLEEVLERNYTEQEVYGEIRENIALMKNLTQTQVQTASVLKTMATADSVTVMVMRIFTSIQNTVRKYVKEPNVIELILLDIAGDIKRFINTGDAGTGLALGRGGEEHSIEPL